VKPGGTRALSGWIWLDTPFIHTWNATEAVPTTLVMPSIASGPGTPQSHQKRALPAGVNRPDLLGANDGELCFREHRVAVVIGIQASGSTVCLLAMLNGQRCSPLGPTPSECVSRDMERGRAETAGSDPCGFRFGKAAIASSRNLSPATLTTDRPPPCPPQMLLSALPVDILLEIIQYLPFTSITSLSALSKPWAAFIDTNESSIYRSTSKRYGFAPKGGFDDAPPPEGWKAWREYPLALPR